MIDVCYYYLCFAIVPEAYCCWAHMATNPHPHQHIQTHLHAYTHTQIHTLTQRISDEVYSICGFHGCSTERSLLAACLLAQNTAKSSESSGGTFDINDDTYLTIMEEALLENGFFSHVRNLTFWPQQAPSCTFATQGIDFHMLGRYPEWISPQLPQSCQ